MTVRSDGPMRSLNPRRRKTRDKIRQSFGVRLEVFFRLVGHVDGDVGLIELPHDEWVVTNNILYL